MTSKSQWKKLKKTKPLLLSQLQRMKLIHNKASY